MGFKVGDRVRLTADASSAFGVVDYGAVFEVVRVVPGPFMSPDLVLSDGSAWREYWLEEAE